MEPEVPPEAIVAEKYRVTRLLGQGGMGSVWEGVHQTLGTRVAIKFIDREIADSADVRLRFINEAKATARLQSKHVVRVLDQGVTDAGWPYIVMEFLAGEALDERLDRVRIISLQDTSIIVTHVGRALAKAHKVGVVHRDLKPENVFLVWDDDDQKDVCKVVDFGIAKFTDPESAPSSSTQTGAVLGTPHFMSPEQARGLRSVDFRSDLWSLGVIAYRSVTGRMPFEGEAVGDLLVKICTEDPIWPSQINQAFPTALDDWFRRALARDSEVRFQSAKDMAASFEELVFSLPEALRQRGDHSLSVPPPPSLGAEADTKASAGIAPTAIAMTQPAVTLGTRPPKNKPRTRKWIAAGAVALAAAVLVLMTRSREADTTPKDSATLDRTTGENAGSEVTPQRPRITARDAARAMGIESPPSTDTSGTEPQQRGPRVEPTTAPPAPAVTPGVVEPRVRGESSTPRAKTEGAQPKPAPSKASKPDPKAAPKVTEDKVTEDELGY